MTPEDRQREIEAAAAMQAESDELALGLNFDGFSMNGPTWTVYDVAVLQEEALRAWQQRTGRKHPHGHVH